MTRLKWILSQLNDYYCTVSLSNNVLVVFIRCNKAVPPYVEIDKCI